ncbi:ATP-dependent chromatin assembly factor large subunit isoform X2 [Lycorma delicatula]|uniref:ATP-dependent chromatin assembly factor large subunit isoform X2 n=1 Tax=Lycorma delicatula TaxID=130591 RepID=UPI003F519B2D
MPLLYKKAFTENEFPAGLKDSDEVFYCELTEEVFTDYEEFCERIYLCNSLVWSCSVTGRSNLTYQEALTSEENARKILGEFPLTLRIPVFYLIALCERKSFAELAEDIFMFIRDRYFVGETVEVCFANETWCDCHVIQVTYPTDKVISEYQANNNNTVNNNNHNNSSAARDYWPPGMLYSYEVEIINNPNKDGSTYFVRGDQVRRRKGLYTREKNRLFLRQYVHQVAGTWKLKDNVCQMYAISEVKASNIFTNNLQTLISRKKAGSKEQNSASSKNSNDKLKLQMKKEKRQESIQKYFKQKSSPSKSSAGGQHNDYRDDNNKKVISQKKPGATPQKSLIQKLKNKYKGVQNVKKSSLMNKINNKKEVLQEKRKQSKKKVNEEAIKGLTKDELLKLALEYKDKNITGMKLIFKKISQGDNMKLNKENRQQLAELIKELNKRREDLECEDLKELPVPTAVQLHIPNECFGDFVLILEFLHSFGSVIYIKDFFPTGVSIELIERALVKKEVAGPMNDLIQLLLTAIFDLQEQNYDDPNDVSGMDCIMDSNKYPKDESEAMLMLSNAASSYSQHYQGAPLSQLTMDCATLTEILRLHLLSSGTHGSIDDPADRNSASLDDPGRALCLTQPHLIELLSQQSIFELSVEHKMQILSCLINQILTFASMRDTIDERGDKIKTGKMDLRNQQAAEIRKRKEAITKAKEQTENGVLTAEQKESLLKDNRSRKDIELLRKARELSEAEMEFQVLPLGADRAYRRFWLFSSLPGLFVEDNELHPGSCLPKGTPHAEGAEECLKFVRKLFEDGGPSNKENLVGINKDLNISSSNNTGSPSKKLLVEKNGGIPLDSATSSSGGKTTPGRNNKVDTKNACKPFTCWGDPLICPIHAALLESKQRTVWSFYKNEMDLNNLIESLNGRGFRESKLKKVLMQEKQRIIDSLAKCPLSKLDPSEVNTEQQEIRKSSRNGPKYDNPNLDFPPGTPVNDVLLFNLRDIILETEEKIYGGLLGSLKVKNRDEWRKALKNNKYDKQCDVLKWGGAASNDDPVLQGADGSSSISNSSDKVKQEDVADSSSITNNVSRCQTPTTLIGVEKLLRVYDNVTQPLHVYNMACAILQLEQAVESRYLKKPLADNEDNDNQEAPTTTSSPTLSSSQDNHPDRHHHKISVKERWEQSLMSSSSLSQLFIHMYTLESSIEWSKSALKSYNCGLCKHRDPDKMLLCDSCNRGYHMYCLKPKLTKVPEGDWFCPKCQQKNDKDKAKKEKKSKRVQNNKESERQKDEETDDKLKEPAGVNGTCRICKKKGELAVCNECNNGFHLECVTPPLRKFPRFSWTCPNCRHQPASNGSSVNKRNTRDKQDFNGDQEDDENNKANDVGATLSRRRSRRSMESSSDAMTTTSSRDLPLDNAALQEILDIVMHHKDAWPFLRPVTKSEVPDYHTIIKTPMDFGTIKHKLNMLEYNKNSQVIADAMLVFNNCYTYNQSDSEVYKAGERLQKVFEKLCNERKMEITHNDVNDNDEDESDDTNGAHCNNDKDDDSEDEIRPPSGKRPRTIF